MVLRSQTWFARKDRDGYEHRSMMRAMGLPGYAFDGRPVIGICNSWSELNPCDAGLRELAQHVRAGVLEAGGLPLEFPAFPVGEPLMRPSPLMFRNLASMAIEELVRANPLDGCVLLAGCDKTTPAMLMAAASYDLPSVLVSSGPKFGGKFRGETIGSGTHIWKIEAAMARGAISDGQLAESEIAMSRGVGTCNTMGTASTMAAIAEVMGIALPYNAAIPAADARRAILARQAGRVAVEAVKADRKPSDIMSRAAFENAVRVVGALGGSTNAALHLLAIARRLNLPFSLDDFDSLGRDVPCLVDLMPSGRFLIEDFDAAGGLPVVLRRLAERGLIDGTAVTVAGVPLESTYNSATCFDDEVIRLLDNPVSRQGGIVVLKGTLAPDGAIMKPSAATAALLQHRARALVFDGLADLEARLDDPELDVAADDILVLRNCGPLGFPGMPEVGNFRLPRKMIEQGVVDMVRISDARMSGTAYGTVVLHVAPEAAAGGPLRLVETGDMIALDVSARRLDLLVAEPVLAVRRAAVGPGVPARRAARGFASLHAAHVMQADKGADLDFLGVGGNDDMQSSARGGQE